MAAALEPWQIELERLRQQRARTPRDAGVAPLLTSMADQLKRSQRAVGASAEAWLSVCPPALAQRCSILGLSRGELRIAVANAAARFEVDRWLRSGGEKLLVDSARTTIRRVKLVLRAEV